MAEGGPESRCLGGQVVGLGDQAGAEDPLGVGRQLTAHSRPATAPAMRSNSSKSPGMASPSGSNSMALRGLWRRKRKRNSSGGRVSAMACAVAPVPLLVLIFLPPMFRNS